MEDLQFLKEDVCNIGTELNIEHASNQNIQSHRKHERGKVCQPKIAIAVSKNYIFNQRVIDWKKTYQTEQFRANSGVQYVEIKCIPQRRQQENLIPLDVFSVMKLNTLAKMLVKESTQYTEKTGKSS